MVRSDMIPNNDGISNTRTIAQLSLVTRRHSHIRVANDDSEWALHFICILYGEHSYEPVTGRQNETKSKIHITEA
jgi:hypothetical protein